MRTGKEAWERKKRGKREHHEGSDISAFDGVGEKKRTRKGGIPAETLSFFAVSPTETNAPKKKWKKKKEKEKISRMISAYIHRSSTPPSCWKSAKKWKRKG